MHLKIGREEEWWIGLCVERDIAVQAKSREGVLKEFADALEFYKSTDYPLEKHPVTPQYALDAFEGEIVEL